MNLFKGLSNNKEEEYMSTITVIKSNTSGWGAIDIQKDFYRLEELADVFKDNLAATHREKTKIGENAKHISKALIEVLSNITNSRVKAMCGYDERPGLSIDVTTYDDDGVRIGQMTLGVKELFKAHNHTAGSKLWRHIIHVRKKDVDPIMGELCKHYYPDKLLAAIAQTSVKEIRKSSILSRKDNNRTNPLRWGGMLWYTVTHASTYLTSLDVTDAATPQVKDGSSTPIPITSQETLLPIEVDTLGKYVKCYRKDNKLSQTKLAEKVISNGSGSGSTISRIEADNRPVSLSSIKAVVTYLATAGHGEAIRPLIKKQFTGKSLVYLLNILGQPPQAPQVVQEPQAAPKKQEVPHTNQLVFGTNKSGSNIKATGPSTSSTSAIRTKVNTGVPSYSVNHDFEQRLVALEKDNVILKNAHKKRYVAFINTVSAILTMLMSFLTVSDEIVVNTTFELKQSDLEIDK